MCIVSVDPPCGCIILIHYMDPSCGSIMWICMEAIKISMAFSGEIQHWSCIIAIEYDTDWENRRHKNGWGEQKLARKKNFTQKKVGSIISLFENLQGEKKTQKFSNLTPDGPSKLHFQNKTNFLLAGRICD
jgi:hypothetical protein